MLAAVLLCSAVMVSAADFHLIDLSRPEHKAVLLDPSTIASAKDGHKSARLAEVGIGGSWSDYKVECDCAGNRFKKLTDVYHSDTAKPLDRSSNPLFTGSWIAGKKGVLSSAIIETVCGWPKAKTKEKAVPGADFEAAIKRASDILSKWWFEDEAADMKD
jgi:hypothetical protein